MPTDADGMPHLRYVANAVGRVGEKMKYGAVVPDVERVSWQIGGQDVCFAP